MAEREILRDAIGVGRVNDGRFAQMAAAFGIFALSQVAEAGAAVENLAGAGDFEPFGNGFSCFDAFGSSHKIYYFNCKRARTILSGRMRRKREIFPGWFGVQSEPCDGKLYGLPGLFVMNGLESVVAGRVTSIGAPRLSWARTASVRSFSPLLYTTVKMPLAVSDVASRTSV